MSNPGKYIPRSKRLTTKFRYLYSGKRNQVLDVETGEWSSDLQRFSQYYVGEYKGDKL